MVVVVCVWVCVWVSGWGSAHTECRRALLASGTVCMLASRSQCPQYHIIMARRIMNHLILRFTSTAQNNPTHPRTHPCTHAAH